METATSLRSVEVNSPGKSIALFSCKGGTGTSTLAANLAYEIRQVTGDPVLLWDTDQIYSNLPMQYGFQPAHGLTELSHKNLDETDEAIFDRLVTRHPVGIDVLVNCKNILDENEPASVELLQKALEWARSRYPYTVIDLPSYILDEYHERIVSQADEIMLTCGMEIPSLYRTRQYLALAGKHDLGNRFRLIINRHSETGCYGVSAAEFEKQLGHPVFARIPDNAELLSKAASLGVFLNTLEPQSDVVRAVQKLALHLVDFDIPAEQLPEPEPLLHKIKALNLGLGLLMGGAGINAISKT